MLDNFTKFVTHAMQADLSRPEAWISILLSVILFLTVFHRYKFSYWSKYGVKAEPGVWFFGNSFNLISKRRLDYELEAPRKLGKVYGYYVGTQPRLAVADAEVLRRICIKDFHLFPNHSILASAPERLKSWVFAMQDDHWKRVRSIMSPTFTSGRMKRMFKLMGQCATELEQLFEEQMHTNHLINCKDVYGLFTMDVITTCCFGVKLDREKGTTDVKAAASRNAFVKSALNMMRPNPIRLLFAFVMPGFILKWLNYSPTKRIYFDEMYARAKGIVEARRAANKNGQRNFDDYLQLLMDADLSTEIDIDDNDTKESHHVSMTNDSIRVAHREMAKAAAMVKGEKNLTDAEVVSNTMFLLFVGYETTGTLLAHCTYALAFHQDIQDKLFLALEDLLKQDDEFTYDNVTGSQYLDTVICETLRLLSPVIRLDRVAKADYHIEDYGITIPKGTDVNCCYYAIHHDPDYWPDPNKFDPSRFSPENRHKIVPGSYCPFGLGPRHCLGMRFALTEAKMALARLIVRYQFLPADDTCFPPEPDRMSFMTKFKNLVVKIKPR